MDFFGADTDMEGFGKNDSCDIKDQCDTYLI